MTFNKQVSKCIKNVFCRVFCWSWVLVIWHLVTKCGLIKQLNIIMSFSILQSQALPKPSHSFQVTVFFIKNQTDAWIWCAKQNFSQTPVLELLLHLIEMTRYIRHQHILSWFSLLQLYADEAKSAFSFKAFSISFTLHKLRAPLSSQAGDFLCG